MEAEGRGSDFDGATGIEVNFGAAPNIQLSLGLPADFAHGRSGWRSGLGDVKLSAKYRFYHSDAAGVSIAIFPAITLPSGSNGMGNAKVTGLLPVWIQRNLGSWSIFGGGGYALNPGPGNRDYWTGSAALTRQIGERWLLGIETSRQGPESIDGRAVTRLGFGATYELRPGVRMLASAGPSFADGAGKTNFHLFAALGMDF